MAERPIFVPNNDGSRLVQEVLVQFKWHPGMAPSQKKKNVLELHRAAQLKGYARLLEVSTKSEERLGQNLSAFNLRIDVPGVGKIPLESAYQGSKVFSGGGPYQDLYSRPPRDAKQDERLKASGPLVGFQFAGDRWELEPKTAFYDWLYIRSLNGFDQFLQQLLAYDAFTDIEFNPAKSLNCQARSCAILVSLMRKQKLATAIESRNAFLGVLRADAPFQPHSQGAKQGHLF